MIISIIVFAAMSLIGALWAFLTLHPVRTQSERHLSRLTPEELWMLYGNLTDIQAQALMAPLIGTWIDISGDVANVQELSCSVEVTLKREDAGVYRHRSILFNFPIKAWRASLATLVRGETIIIRGEIEQITRRDMHIVNCELPADS
ncbi:MAG TPA: hypothetical protein VNR42_11505 [Solirubrobacteraceae bacterium]|nr:hypothetical protein [Solirubrobacteraceae bacterium]